MNTHVILIPATKERIEADLYYSDTFTNECLMAPPIFIFMDVIKYSTFQRQLFNAAMHDSAMISMHDSAAIL